MFLCTNTEKERINMFIAEFYIVFIAVIDQLCNNVLFQSITLLDSALIVRGYIKIWFHMNLQRNLPLL